MRIKLLLAAVLGIIILLGVAMVPWLDGMMFKRQYYDFIKALETEKHVKIKIEEYHEGWFSSDAKLSIAPSIDPAAAPQMIGYTTPTLILEQSISHGPYVSDPISGQKTFALAAIQSNMHLPSSIEALLLGNQASPNGVITINGLMTFWGDFLNQIKTPVFNINLPGVGEFVWQGLDGSINFHMEGRHIQSVVSDITVGAMSLRSGADSVITQNINMKSDMTPDVTGLWNGNYVLTVPEITFVNASGTMSVKNMNFSDDFGVVAKHFYNTKMQVSVGQLIIPQFSANQSNLHISIENINAKALMNLVKAVNQGGIAKMEESQQYLAMLPALVAPTTVVKNDALINTGYGRFMANGQISWPGMVQSLDDLNKNATLTEELRISISLANQLIDTFAPAPAQQPDLSASQPTEQNLLKHLDDLGAQNKIDLSVAVEIKDLVQTHLPPASFAKFIDQSVKLKQLPADIGAQLKTQYALIKNASKNPPAAPQPAPLTPAEQMKRHLANLVAQGYIKQDKDDYVMSITVQQGVMKSNGLDVSQMKQGQ